MYSSLKSSFSFLTSALALTFLRALAQTLFALKPKNNSLTTNQIKIPEKRIYIVFKPFAAQTHLINLLHPNISMHILFNIL